MMEVQDGGWVGSVEQYEYFHTDPVTTLYQRSDGLKSPTHPVPETPGWVGFHLIICSLRDLLWSASGGVGYQKDSLRSPSGVVPSACGTTFMRTFKAVNHRINLLEDEVDDATNKNNYSPGYYSVPKKKRRRTGAPLRRYDMSKIRRQFTREEDELILANANGEVSLNFLLRRLNCGQETLERRAHELGLFIVIEKKAKSNHKKKYYGRYNGDTLSSPNEAPHVGEDKLLQRLFKVHGDRRYDIPVPLQSPAE